MKLKRITIILFVVLMLMSVVLTGCREPYEQPREPDEPFAPPIQNVPRRGEPVDPNRPMPERNPDGTLG